ncbi:large ribosomal subunit protein mL46 [Chironomus tepperi]|uniref:large ribosomal subunit protein mL46 n=1 Tax=Chironomus tepperi TaxID=113505 RepID=UPI00391EE262
MLRKIIQNSLIIQSRRLATVANSGTKQKYDIYAGVLIERLPIVSKKLNDIENEVLQMFQTIEFENSLKSDHEIRKEKDKRKQKLLKAGKVDNEGEQDSIILQTAQDFEDAGHDELAKFECAPRETEDDKKNNTKSLNRKLDDTLMFVCNHQLGKENVTLLPQDKWIEGETLRQTAERIVREKCGTDLKVHFYGNAPIGFYKYKYPASERKESVGAKVFFFRAIYNSGDVTDQKLKYEWVNDDELKTKIKSDSYYESLKSFCC